MATILWLPLEQSPPRIFPPKTFKAASIPSYRFSIQSQEVSAGVIKPTVMPCIFSAPLPAKSEILAATDRQPTSLAFVVLSVK